MTLAVLAVFIPTFIFVSVTPGMCMTLSMTLGMTIGVRKTLWMMAGELLAVGGLALLVLVGGAAFMLEYPSLFTAFKTVGGAYLFWIGVQLWQSRGRMAVQDLNKAPERISRKELAMQGFVTAIANPKGWAFFISLLPPFIDPDTAMAPQIIVMLSLILFIEFLSLLAYASGGRTLRKFLSRSNNVRLMNRVAGTLMMGVGVWLALT
ncbi:LysE family translocator [Parendozoicomonas haliclonae]|uniref:Homoserine/homoserine lactone efflux protein n=1 Tax=Parendozoicomonas haliclonae TaxID=1960125 RepID=A0A1X7AND6_9GAMM|nr:LysE family translocator [Parendozoicomonas haliclonae]SMA49587.1 Homoserine/homoserine lactone efflux protein [Parendozoicomonas haliclonae]